MADENRVSLKRYREARTMPSARMTVSEDERPMMSDVLVVVAFTSCIRPSKKRARQADTE